MANNCDQNDQDINSTVSDIIRSGDWSSAIVLLRDSQLDEENSKHLLQEACILCKDEHMLREMVKYSDQNTSGVFLTNMVTRSLWSVVGDLLQRGVSDLEKQWAIQEASRHAHNKAIRQHILPHCAGDQLDEVVTTLVERGLWDAVGQILQGHDESCNRFVIPRIWETADESDIIKDIIPHCFSLNLDSSVEILAARGMWTALVELLQHCVTETLCRWAVAKDDTEPNDAAFWDLARIRCDNVKHLPPKTWISVLGSDRPCTDSQFTPNLFGHFSRNPLLGKADCLQANRHQPSGDFLNSLRNLDLMLKIHESLSGTGTVSDRNMAKRLQWMDRLEWDTPLCEVLYEATMEVMRETWLRGPGTDAEHQKFDAAGRAQLTVNKIHEDIKTTNLADMSDYTARLLPRIQRLCQFFEQRSVVKDPLYVFHLIKNVMKNCYIRKKWETYTKAMLMILACVPVHPELQSVALRVLLRHKEWDVIRHARLSHVWEQDRRHLFQAAVKQRQWSVVKQWADHTLYDDQRLWALEKAFKDKQWEIYLLLADHGLTSVERMRVHSRLARFADWEIVLQMFERGGDVAEVRERLGIARYETRTAECDKEGFAERHIQLFMYEKELRKKQNKGIKHNLLNSNWQVLLFAMIRTPCETYLPRALKFAIKRKAWHVVVQLVRLGMDTAQKNSLFSKMLKLQQWGVCRVLLEQRLSVELCLEVLPQLLEMKQWTLVARVMEHEVGNDRRQEVMEHALEMNEGSVVWQCIFLMNINLSIERRRTLFHDSLIRQLWQIIKPLVEWRDRLGIQHRDSAMWEAIEYGEWDVLDHCQRYKADINIKDDEGHTPLQRAAMKKDWEAVEELVVRDGDPNLLDKEGCSVLNRAIEREQWSTVKVLVMYGADIHQTAKSVAFKYSSETKTPLQMLIEREQGEVIEHTLMWCPDQSRAEGKSGETALHAVCVSGWSRNLQYMVARLKDPLALTNHGQSALLYATLNRDHAKRMVAECIRLGFGVHQQSLTDICQNLSRAIGKSLHGIGAVSPFVYLLLHGAPLACRMLFESGFATYSELFRFTTELEAAYMDAQNNRTGPFLLRDGCVSKCIREVLPFLKDLATTPRSLQASCRLVISHHFDVRHRRHRAVYRLPLSQKMKEYILFSDLTDPDYGKDMEWHVWYDSDM